MSAQPSEAASLRRISDYHQNNAGTDLFQITTAYEDRDFDYVVGNNNANKIRTENNNNGDKGIAIFKTEELLNDIEDNCKKKQK